jgi:hypothetical protein
MSPAQVDAAASEAALAGHFVRWPWATLHLEHGPFAAQLRVACHYFAVGEDKGGHMFMPLTPIAAQVIADANGWLLPTRKIVDECWRQAAVHLEPVPMLPDELMCSFVRFFQHSARVSSNVTTWYPDKLMAGMKKDVVLTNQRTPGRVAIYGWHRLNGQVIQPLNAVSHADTYVDYSHGVRFVDGAMTVNGDELRTADVLRDPELAWLISDEGPLREVAYGGSS